MRPASKFDRDRDASARQQTAAALTIVRILECKCISHFAASHARVNSRRLRQEQHLRTMSLTSFTSFTSVSLFFDTSTLAHTQLDSGTARYCALAVGLGVEQWVESGRVVSTRQMHNAHGRVATSAEGKQSHQEGHIETGGETGRPSVSGTVTSSVPLHHHGGEREGDILGVGKVQ